MKKILIIIPYFGNLPETFPFWYQSAKDNQDVDFLFITDQEVGESSNFHVMKTSFKDLKARFEEALGMEVNMPSPYKLCDFKPVYGYVYSKELEGYDFWGFGDIDLVYGRIRHFFTDDVLDNYDMISGWGHLTLLRNCDFCNTFFMQRHGKFLYWKDAFSRPEYSGFDEYFGGCSEVWDALYPDKVYHCESSLDDITIPACCRHFRSVFVQGRYCLTFIYEDRNLYRIYIDRHLRRHKEPTLYAHFQKRHGWKIDIDDCSRYIIYPNVFRRPFRFLQNLKLTILGSSKTTKLRKV